MGERTAAISLLTHSPQKPAGKDELESYSNRVLINKQRMCVNEPLPLVGGLLLETHLVHTAILSGS